MPILCHLAVVSYEVQKIPKQWPKSFKVLSRTETSFERVFVVPLKWRSRMKANISLQVFYQMVEFSNFGLSWSLTAAPERFLLIGFCASGPMRLSIRWGSKIVASNNSILETKHTNCHIMKMLSRWIHKFNNELSFKSPWTLTEPFISSVDV